MLFGYMIGDPTLYKVKNFGSSKMFVTRVFCAYVITLSTAISLDWCKIETTWNHFYLQSRLCPIDWCHCCEGHVTILLTVLRFLASRSHTNSRKRGLGNVHGRGSGPRSWVKGGPYWGHGVTRVDSDHVFLPSFGRKWTHWTLTQRGS